MSESEKPRRREILRFALPIPPGEERLPADVPQLVALLKILQEVRRIGEELGGRLRAIEEALRARGEVVALTVTVSGTRIVEPGRGRWRQVNMYNEGPGPCYVRLNSEDASPVQIEAEESRSWSFLTEVIEKLYVTCDRASTLEFEFLR